MFNQDVEPLETPNPKETPQTHTYTPVPAHDHDELAKLCRAVEHSAHTGPPYISGTFPLAAHETGLFYRSQQGVLGCLDFANASLADLEALAYTCQPASFGLNGLNVLDPTYRKAGKLDASCFATQFSPERHGIIDIIQRDLFNGDTNSNVPELSRGPGIKLEMYKLNVYGPGSFFKPHVDTPRGSNMFGSLVVVLPTLHEGGKLIIRHTNQEWSIDSASDTTGNASGDGRSGLDTDVNNRPVHASFAAFYSDVEHEVTPVISGYRVTLTYLLSFVHPPPSPSTSPSPPLPNPTLHAPNPAVQIHASTLTTLTANLSALLSHPYFLPSGGLIGFKLIHRYPIDTTLDEYSRADYLRKNLTPCLKGPDARMFKALSSLALPVQLRSFYKFEQDIDSHPRNTPKSWRKYMTSGIVEATEGFNGGHTLEDSIRSERSARLVDDLDLKSGGGLSIKPDIDMGSHVKGGWEMSKPPRNSKRDPLPICWINPIKNSKVATYVRTPYIAAAGNEATVEFIYGEVAMICQVGKVGDRTNVVPFMGMEEENLEKEHTVWPFWEMRSDSYASLSRHMHMDPDSDQDASNDYDSDDDD